MFSRTTRRALAVGVITLAAGLAGGTGSAQANICAGNFLLDGVGGQTIYVGEYGEYQVPKVEDVLICAGAGVVYLDTFPVRVYSGCGPTCFAVFAPAGLQSGNTTAEVCYTVDGVRSCVGPDYEWRMPTTDRCLLSSGRPAQHQPGECLVVLDQTQLGG